MESESSSLSQCFQYRESKLKDEPLRCSSPEKCAVCLNFKRANETSSIDSCSHTFCYSCIWEWSKVRAICPLCKQPFTSIQRPRDGYSGEIFETVSIQPPPQSQSLQDVLDWVSRHGSRINTTQNSSEQEIFRQMVYMEWLHTLQSIVQTPRTKYVLLEFLALDKVSMSLVYFSFTSTASALPSRATTGTTIEQSSSSASSMLSPLVRGNQNWSSVISLDTIHHYLQRYLRQTTSDLRQSTIHSASTRQTVAFRKYIYLNSLYVQLPATNNQTRQCSPQWYRENPACLHRLVPFLARELLALLWNDERTIEQVIRQILQTIQHNEIKSRRVKRQLFQYLGRHTKHFLHEFYSFSQCPYDVLGFDRHAIYERRLNRQEQIGQSSPVIDVVDSENEDEQQQQNDAPVDLNQIPLVTTDNDITEISTHNSSLSQTTTSRARSRSRSRSSTHSSQTHEQSMSTNSRESYSSVPQYLPSTVVRVLSNDQQERGRLSSLITIPERRCSAVLTDIEDDSYTRRKTPKEN
ncbi:unnamed protein product [Didymodactylos carnosus]|uniref:RING-type E3 ubiquitin transferase n=1 Tax=Didymodactylos carnosus TaxID=1234261 RepID=A0A814B9B2_9BILA|nr:unnamed protein product [Didymodactylos carnosus]CAF1076872.1 unnamed protein product [Didymodactylos carnosus]CAF3703385.1 unnamed protein product [Didymodactylos carnosus]CAF3840458.1 unnamed protein product [Didymodactylos carnosus]